MTFETIRYEIEDDGILVITLDRPERMNAFTVTMCRELVEAFGRASKDDSVRAVVVTGAGKAFCAGMDLGADGNPFGLDEAMTPTMASLTAGMDDPAMLNGVRDTGGRVTLAIDACEKPVIAAINGAAVGIGATMTLAMDFRLAADSAVIGFVFGRIGIVPEACSTWFLPNLVGLQQALEWVLRAEPFPAHEGLTAGLLRSIHRQETLLDDAMAFARTITRGRSATGVALSRRMLRNSARLASPVEAHRIESLAVHWTSQRDGREGVAAFREKRVPCFTDRVSCDLPPDRANWWPV